MLDFKGRTALVTGASSGIGLELARAIAREGVSLLILVARREELLRELGDELTRELPGLRVDVRPTDLGDRAATTALLDSLDTEGIEIDVLINNAGMADYGPFVERGWEKMHETLEVNVVAPTQFLQRFMPRMVERGFGAVLNVGSSAGSVASPSLGVYAATKAYTNLLSEVLSAELDGTGVTVTALLPGPVETGFKEASGADRDPPIPQMFFVEAKDVAEEAVQGLKKGEVRVVPGKPMQAAVLGIEALPKALLRPVLKQVAKALKSDADSDSEKDDK